jgi:hypothetical protein
VAVFSEGAIRHTAVIPIAGDQITNDIAMALRTPLLKRKKSKCALVWQSKCWLIRRIRWMCRDLVIAVRVPCHARLGCSD